MKTLIRICVVSVLLILVAYTIYAAQQTPFYIPGTGTIPANVPIPIQQEEVKLFQDFTWEDSLIGVINKLNKLGLETIIFSERMANRRVGDPNMNGVNLKGVNTAGQVKEKLIELLRIHSFVDDKGRRKPSVIKIPQDCYIGKDGQERMTFNNLGRIASKIVAGPVNIGGVPFNLTIEFAYAPGLELYRSENVLIMGDMAFPLIIKVISLNSITTSTVIPEQEIRKAIAATHPRAISVPRPFPRDGNFVVEEDQFGNYMTTQFTEKFCRIEYGSGGSFARKLDQLYKNHVSDLERQGVKGKSDQSGKL